jgi:hypothetical protein
MALAISSNKHHTHKYTHTHTHSHETRGNQSVVLPPAKPPSLLFTAPPRSSTNQPLSQPSRHLSTTATSTSASLWDACCCMPQRGSLCGLAVLVDDGRAMLVKPWFVAELAEKDAFLRRRAIVLRIYCLSLPPTHTHTHTHTHASSMYMYKMTVGNGQP